MNNPFTFLTALLLSLACSIVPLSAQDGPGQAELDLMREALSTWFSASNPDPSHFRVHDRRERAFYSDGFGLIMPTPTYVSRLSAPRSSHIQVYTFPRKDSSMLTADTMRNAVIEIMQTFLIDYGDLLPSLKPNERIVLTYQQQTPREVPLRFSENHQGGTTILNLADVHEKATGGQVTLSLQLKDLSDYRAGRINRDALITRMETQVKAKDEPEPPAYRMLETLLRRQLDKAIRDVYEVDAPEEHIFFTPLHGTVYGSSRMSHRRLDGYGVVYEYEVRQRGLTWIAQTLDDDDNDKEEPPSEEEKDELIDEMAEVLTQVAPEALVTYGRTLRDLPENGSLDLILHLPGCDKCEAPAKVTIKVPQNILRRYDRGEVDLPTAVKGATLQPQGKAQDTPTSQSWRIIRGAASDVGGLLLDFNDVEVISPGTIIIDNEGEE